MKRTTVLRKAILERRAVAAVIQEGKVRTYDMGGKDSTLDMAKTTPAKL
jgi:isocitrate/isopropylmalate dehydrogenase